MKKQQEEQRAAGRELGYVILQAPAPAPDVESYSIATLIIYPTIPVDVGKVPEGLRNEIKQQQENQDKEEEDEEGPYLSWKIENWECPEGTRPLRGACGPEDPRDPEGHSPIIDTDGLMYLCELMEHLLMTMPKPKQLGKQQAKLWGDAFRKRAQAQLNHKTCDAQEANKIAAALVLFEACKKPIASHVMNLGVYLVHFETMLTHAFDALSALGTTQTLTQNTTNKV